MPENIITEIQAKGLDKLVTDFLAAAKAGRVLDTQVGEIATQFTEFQNSAKGAADTTTKTFRDYKTVLDEVKSGQTSARTASLELRNQLISLHLEGKTGTQVYKDTSKALGEVKLAMKIVGEEASVSGNKLQQTFSLITRSAQLGVASFGAMEGAASLMGGEHKKLSETLIKLNGLMLIANSLQQINAELERQDNIFTTLLTAAKKAYAAVVEEATAATIAFRVALIGLGLGAVILAVYELVKNWGFLKSAITGVSEETEKLLAQQERELQKSKDLIKSLEIELRFRQAIGNLDDIGATQKLAAAQKDAADKAKAYLITQNNALKELIKNSNVYVDVQSTTVDALGGVTVTTEKLAKASKRQVDAQAALVKKATEDFETLSADAGESQQKLADQIKAKTEQAQKDLLKSLKDNLELRLSYLDIELSKKQGNEKEEIRITNEKIKLQAQINALGESAGKQAYIFAKADLDIKKNTHDIEKKYSDETFKRETDHLNAQLKLAKKNSEEELAIKIAIVNEKQRQDSADVKFSIANAVDKKKRIADIDATANQERLQLEVNFQQEQDKIQLGHAVSLAKLKLDTTRKGSVEELEANKEFLIASERAAENAQDTLLANKTISEIEYNDNIRALNAKLLKDLDDANRAFEKKKIEDSLTLQNLGIDAEIIQIESKRYGASIDTQNKIDEQIRQLNIQKIKNELTALDDEYTAKEKLDAEYRIKKAKLDNDLVVAQVKSADATRAEEKAQRDSRIQDAVELNNALVGFTNELFSAELANAQERKDKGIINEKEYAKEVAKIKRQQAIAAKAEAAFNIGINIAQAISKALAETGVFGIVLQGIIAALGLAQLAIVLAKPIPSTPGFYKGVIGLEDNNAPNGIDTVPARLTKGESVMTNTETKKYKDVLWSIRKDNFDQMFVPVKNINHVLHRLPRTDMIPVSTHTGKQNEQFNQMVLTELFHLRHAVKSMDRNNMEVVEKNTGAIAQSRRNPNL